MKNILCKLLFFAVITGCVQQRLLRMDWIDESNATPVQKQALRDGCMYPNLQRQRSTLVRDVGGIVMNPYYMQNSEYTGTWRDGMWMCYMALPSIENPYLRGWNTLGFKGDSIAYKGN